LLSAREAIVVSRRREGTKDPAQACGLATVWYDFSVMKRFFAVALAAGLLAAQPAQAQRTSRRPAPAPKSKAAAPAPAGAPRTERPVPFKIGETLTYDVSWLSYVTAGTATTTVKEKKASFDSTAYYIVAEGRPTPLVAKLYTLYYKMDTLLDAFTLLPQRGSVYSEEGNRHRFKISRFDHAAHKVFFEYESTGKVTDTFTVPPYVQDALSAIYVLRAVPLESGARITMPVTDNGTNYRIQVNVGAAEQVKTPFGEASAWKLNLAITDASGKPQGRNIFLWMTDDPRRLPMKLQAELPIGSFNLALREAR
jgi:hypothetical protein